MGAAGLLRGYEATSDWAARKILPMFGATPVEGRVVTDRNRISGGGVTAGLDFGLVIHAQMLGDDIAKVTQLAMEYDPEPPFDVGTPEKAGPTLVAKVHDWLGSASGDKMAITCSAAAKAMDEYATVVK